MYQINIYTGPILRGFWVLTSPNMVRFWWKLHTRGSILADKNSVWKTLKNLIFYENGTDPDLRLLLQFWTHITPWRWPKSKKINISGKILNHWTIKICQNQGPIFSLLSGKNTIIFCTIWAIYVWKQGRVTHSRVRIKIWLSLFYQQDSWST